LARTSSMVRIGDRDVAGNLLLRDAYWLNVQFVYSYMYMCIPAAICCLHLLQVAWISPGTFITTGEGWTMVLRSCKWSLPQQRQQNPFSLILVHRYPIHTRRLQVANWIGRSTMAEHKWHTKSSMDTELVLECITREQRLAGLNKLLCTGVW
jgi:hypothetical protein